MSDNKPPVKVLTDRLVKVKIWEHEGEHGIYYSAQPIRIYEAGEKDWKETNSFSNADLLRISRLMFKAYDVIEKLQAVNKQLET
jgi:hypothetical protein